MSRASVVTTDLHREIHQLRGQEFTIKQIAEKLNLSVGAVHKYANSPVEGLPEPAPEAGGSDLPEPVKLTYNPFDLQLIGNWLVLNDVHIPYHDPNTVRSAVEEAVRIRASGVVLNGDILDCHQLSHHYREPDKGRFVDEVEKAKQFLKWLRSRLPAARIVFKEGNHEFRLQRYLAERTPELFGLEGFDLPSVLKLKDYGIEWVQDKRVINVGKLAVVHGHEFRGGGGVNPARWLFLRAVSTALCGHFHRSSEHFEQALDRRLHGVWSVGCACYLYPQYDPQNKWNHGYAIVEVSQGGMFRVVNRRILPDGRVV